MELEWDTVNGKWGTNYDMPYQRPVCILDRLDRLERQLEELNCSDKDSRDRINTLRSRLAKSKWFPFWFPF